MASVLETRPAATALAEAADHHDRADGTAAAVPATTDGFHLVIDAL